jgi:hypothetical protein
VATQSPSNPAGDASQTSKVDPASKLPHSLSSATDNEAKHQQAFSQPKLPCSSPLKCDKIYASLAAMPHVSVKTGLAAGFVAGDGARCGNWDAQMM